MTELFIGYVIGVVLVAGFCLWVGMQDDFGEPGPGAILFVGFLWPVVLTAILFEIVLSKTRDMK